MSDAARVTAASAVSRSHEIRTPEALAFVADLQRTFGARRDDLLARRADRYVDFLTVAAYEMLD